MTQRVGAPRWPTDQGLIELCRREGIAQSKYYGWSMVFGRQAGSTRDQFTLLTRFPVAQQQ
jgi:hypothetical protein